MRYKAGEIQNRQGRIRNVRVSTTCAVIHSNESEKCANRFIYIVIPTTAPKALRSDYVAVDTDRWVVETAATLDVGSNGGVECTLMGNKHVSLVSRRTQIK